MTPIRGRELLHENNTKRLLSMIYSQQPISRVAMARALHLNKSTVSALYNELDEQGYVQMVGAGDSTNVGGRKPVLITINGRHGYLLSFDIGFNHLHIMANYFDGRVAFFRRIPTRGETIQQIISRIDTAIHEAADTLQTDQGLLGLCFSIHGIVDQETIINSPFIDMGDVDLVHDFTEKYQVPVVLENEANLAAIYERDFGQHTDTQNILVVSIHKGIGAGIILDDRLYRGTGGMAGEIGRSLLFTANDLTGQAVVEKKVEDYCSEDAIIDQIKALKHLDTLGRDEVVALYQAHDPATVATIHAFTQAIAKIIFNVATTLAPQTVCLNSPLIEAIPELLTKIQTAAQRLQIKQPISLMENTHYATLLGACSLLLRHVLDIADYQLTLRH